ncbi:hypothetical protein CsSME_00052014 [Camellia sinensis var. sinensis]
MEGSWKEQESVSLRMSIIYLRLPPGVSKSEQGAPHRRLGTRRQKN